MTASIAAAGASRRRKHTYTCALCGAPFQGYGHNPAPLAQSGRACDACQAKVVAARVALAKEGAK